MALAERISMREDSAKDRPDADVVLGDDWVAPDSTVEKELRDSRAKRALFSLNRSPLTRKIITFNLIALNVLVAGILWLNSSRDTLAVQRANALQAEAELIADIFETQLPSAEIGLGAPGGIDMATTMSGIELREGAQLLVFDSSNFLVGEAAGSVLPLIRPQDTQEKPTLISDFLNSVWQGVSGLFTYFSNEPELLLEDKLRRMIEAGDPSVTWVEAGQGSQGETLFHVFSPIQTSGTILGTVALVSTAAEIDAGVSAEIGRAHV